MRSNPLIVAPWGALLAALLVGCASAPPPPEPPPQDAPRPLASPQAASLVDRSIDLALAGDAHGAHEAAREARHLDRDGLATGVAWVEALLGVGRRTAALRAAEDVVARHPRAVEAHYALGRAYLALSRRSDALTAFESALALDPNDLPSLHGLLAVHAAREGADDEVAELAALLRERAPGDPYLLHNLGVAAELRGDVPAAQAYYREAITAAAGPHPAAHYNLARLYDGLDDAANARVHYEAFLREAGPASRRLADAVNQRLEQLR